ncbi:zinc-binding dehydrogenase [Thermocatellispora tengchongensis]|uniref:zinc-binding dehydrogenase n=1 Tax=Thermocatellispora tengchongensis TaxID=1073253 RepID=UPI00338B6532
MRRVHGLGRHPPGRCPARARVAIVGVGGIGGIGHFAIQFAKAAGYHVIAVTASAGKHAPARELGADDVVAGGAALKEVGWSASTTPIRGFPPVRCGSRPSSRSDRHPGGQQQP